MAEDKPSREQIEQIAERLSYLEQVLREQLARIHAIENHLGIDYKPAGRIEAHAPAIDQAEKESATKKGRAAKAAAAAPRAPFYKRVLSAPPRPHQAASATVAAAPKARADLESRIGGNWFNRIGILAICFGVAFFLKYAFENEWIGPAGRVLIGIAVGLSFLAAGERMRARYPSYAYGLSGGGILILYLSVYAAYARYGLIEHLIAFLLMAMVTTTAALLAARYNALAIAVLGLIGGFLTPVLLSTGVDNQAALFGYVALLDGGVLALAYSKQWRSLNYMAFAATALVFAAWVIEWYEPEKLWPTMFFLTLLFAIFALLAVLYNIINLRPTEWLDLMLVFFNALFYFAASYELLDDYYAGWLGPFAILLSGFYLALGYFAYRRDREDRLLTLTFLGLASLFLVLAVPIQLNQHWVTIGWAIEGAIMTWIGLRAGDKTSRYAAPAVFLVAAAHWLIIDAPYYGRMAQGNFVPLFNSRALSCIVLIASLGAAAWFYKRYADRVEDKEGRMLGGLLMLVANAMAVILLSVDVHDYFDQSAAQEGAQQAGGALYESPLDNARQLSLSLVWVVYGGAMLSIGILRGNQLLRVMALLLLGMTIIKVFFVDLAALERLYRIISFIALGAILLAVSFLYQRFRQRAAESTDNA